MDHRVHLITANFRPIQICTPLIHELRLSAGQGEFRLRRHALQRRKIDRALAGGAKIALIEAGPLADGRNLARTMVMALCRATLSVYLAIQLLRFYCLAWASGDTLVLTR